MQLLRSDKQTAEDALWREKGLKKTLENEINELRAQLKDVLSQQSELKNHSMMMERYKEEADRLVGVENECMKLRNDNEEM